MVREAASVLFAVAAAILVVLFSECYFFRMIGNGDRRPDYPQRMGAQILLRVFVAVIVGSILGLVFRMGPRDLTHSKVYDYTAWTLVGGLALGLLGSMAAILGVSVYHSQNTTYRCPNCGREMRSGTPRCPECGRAIRWSHASPSGIAALMRIWH